MKIFRSYAVFLPLSALLVSAFFSTGASLGQRQPPTGPAAGSREDAYRANNIGVALLEQFNHKEAAEAFRNALKIEPKLNLAQINLSIALFNVPDLPAAQRAAQNAALLMPAAPQPLYILGLIAKSQSRLDEALTAFQRVLKLDPNDVGTNINVGQIYSQQRKYPEAIAAFRLALAAEPYNATALYSLGQALLRAGQREAGQNVTELFKQLRERGSATTLGQNYLEQGRYAEAVASTGAEAELVDRATPSVSFIDATASLLPGLLPGSPDAAPTSTSVVSGHTKLGELSDAARREIALALGGNATLFDYDGDGDLDLFAVTRGAQHLYRNDGGKFVDITNQSGALATKREGTIGAVAGDFDNDGKPDLFVIRDGSLALFHNDGSGKFTDVTSAAAIPAYPYLPSSVAFVDVDHDGDLDIVVIGLADLSRAPAAGTSAVFPTDFAEAPNLLLRNDGNGKFTDVTTSAKLNTPGHAVGLVPTDFNNRRDMDLLVLSYGKTPELFSNQRDGTFRNIAKDVGLDMVGPWTCVAAGDVNKDSFTDFFFGRMDGPGLFAMSDGKEKFKTSVAPLGSEATRAAQFLDYDNDGLLDCVTHTDKGVRVWRNIGDGWNDTSERAVALELKSVAAERLFAAGDIDNDGDTDIIIGSSGSLRVGRNDGGNANHSLRVNLTGKVSNRSAVGAKIEARSGSLVQKLETSSASPAVAPADVLFGLGKRLTADAVRVLWPAGIVQAETDIAKLASTTDPKQTASSLKLSVTELDRKPSSCPYLYAWNGERFEFITDFMGGGEMGYLEEPGRHNTPDPIEYVRIRGDQLKERNGRYELRVTNELEEALFADCFQLIAVDHPQGVEIYPNEGMTDPPRPFKLYTTRDAQPPLTAVDNHGNDVLSRITNMDRRYPDDFLRDRIRGYAAEHTLTMKLAETDTVNANLQNTGPRNTGTAGVPPDAAGHKFNLTNTGRSSHGASRFSGRDARGSRKRGLASHKHPTNERMLLLLTGWTDYAWSSDNVAAAQSSKSMTLPSLQVKDAKGQWRTVIQDIGIPVGRPQTVTVDLTGKFLSANREIRIVTNMRILWDQILVDTSDEQMPLRMMRLDPVSASLRWRGFSREITPDGREPFGYDYEQISFASPWKVMPGRYTREGDVRELLIKADDMFVISRPGDEISLSFDARKLPPVRTGWTRTFLLYADGYSKEMDINSASPDQVSPLPFHGMTKYPYDNPEAYPMTAARRAYLNKYNTRLVTREVPSIDTLLTITTNFVVPSTSATHPETGPRK
ncbi:MAG TPA: FG-GAP-like repeat-containing protein [Pyrinomonadaceae bacterium]|nr:FG-GAP-like repeat-containing protein [Pyrinomonadaceae bacterium]